jgi:hypothetical protein
LKQVDFEQNRYAKKQKIRDSIALVSNLVDALFFIGKK